MRRIAALLSVPLLAVLALAGCGSSTSSSTPSVSVKGQFGTESGRLHPEGDGRKSAGR